MGKKSSGVEAVSRGSILYLSPFVTLWGVNTAVLTLRCSYCTAHKNYQARATARSAGFSRIKKIPYQAPPTQLGPRNAILGPKYQC